MSRQLADGTTVWVAPSAWVDRPLKGAVCPWPTVSVASPSAGGVAASGSGATPVTGAFSTITAMSLIEPEALGTSGSTGDGIRR